MSHVNHIGLRIGPFHYSPDAPLLKRTAGGKDYTVGVASAYNAFGLIGPEHNGVFVLDETDKQVCMDRHAEISSGYYGPAREQLAEQARVAALPDAEFLTFIRTHPRSRFT